MESNRITCGHRYAACVIVQMFAFSCLLTCGCEIGSTQQMSCDDDNPQKEKIEHIDEVRLPESERRYEASSIQQISSTYYDPQAKVRIEHIIEAKLPESVENCRYDSKNYGMGHGIGWGYFNISRADLLYLLDASDNLPDATELGQDPGAMENIERAMQQAGKNITWWKPLTLQKRQYAEKIIESLGLVGIRQIDICVGKTQNELMGVYLVYHCDL